MMFLPITTRKEWDDIALQPAQVAWCCGPEAEARARVGVAPDIREPTCDGASSRGAMCPPAVRTTRERSVRGRLRIRGECCETDSDRIVQVPLGLRGRTYAYMVRGARLGDAVEVHGRLSGWTVAVVVGFGREGYSGPIKRGRLVR